MKLLGITGGIGAGKSTVTRIFSDLGATCIDADVLAREVLEPGQIGYQKVIEVFGDGILQADGRIDRKGLAKIVFQKKEKLAQLNQITHQEVFKRMEEEIKRAKTQIVCLDVPLLFTSEFPFHCTKTIAVLAPLSVRMDRVVKRDHSTEEDVLARIQAQLSDNELRNLADYIIINDGSLTDTKKQVQEIYQQVMESMA